MRSNPIMKGKNYTVRIKDSHTGHDWNTDKTSNLGPHTVIIETDCDDLVIWTRIAGDALVYVPLMEESKRYWVGSFSLPMGGSYEIETRGRRLGCDDVEEGRDDDDGGDLAVENFAFEASGSKSELSPNSSSPSSSSQVRKNNFTRGIFANGAWVTTSRHNIKYRMINTNLQQQPKSQSHIYADPQMIMEQKEQIGITANNKNNNHHKSFILQNGIISNNNKNYFESFTNLSNYELVCWIGSQSATRIREAFLRIRPQIFPSQRPFKFHMYPMTSFISPDETWSDEQKRGFRKCKHLLVSMDEPSVMLSQMEYQDQLVVFLNHLLKAFQDDSFPIWVLTHMESPLNAKNCYEPYVLKEKRTTDHPCNDVLKHLLLENSTIVFPDRVRLMDNSDLTLPFFSDDAHDGGEIRDEVLAAVALRIFVMVGKQVKEWRDEGQVGTVKGLLRGDVTEPNFDLVPYDWS